MMKKFQFSKADWIKEKNLDKKEVVFLDTFVWSKIVRRENGNFIKLKDLLLRLVKEGKIIVAINISLISEVVDRADKGQARGILLLFDKLSNGVFLTNTYVLFPKELKSQLVALLANKPLKKLEREVVFGPFWEILGEAQLVKKRKDAVGLSDKQAQGIFRKLTEVRLTDYPEAWFYNKGEYRKASKKYLEDRYKKNIPELTYEEILKEEQDDLGRGQIGVILKVADEILVRVVYEGLGSQRKYKDIIKNRLKKAVNDCPTFNVSTKLHAKTRYLRDKRKSIKVNHFYDIFHLANAIPYCDYVICDKEMAHISNNELKLNEKYGCKIVSSNQLGELVKTWEKSLLSI